MIPDPTQIIDPFDPEPIEYIPGPGVYDPTASAIVDEGEFEGVGTIRIVDSLLARNYAPTDGAAVHGMADGTLEITGSTIEDNTSEGNGGGVYTAGGKVTIKDTTFDQNLAHANGGGYYSTARSARSACAARSRSPIRRSRATRRGRSRAASTAAATGSCRSPTSTSATTTRRRTPAAASRCTTGRAC